MDCKLASERVQRRAKGKDEDLPSSASQLHSSNVYLSPPSLEFCFFEVGKKIGVELAGSKEAAQKNRTAIYILGASGAEVIATTLLTPLEAARIRLVSDRTYAKGLASALTRVFKDGQAYAG